MTPPRPLLALSYALLLSFALSACAGNESPGQRLQTSVTAFNHALRWDNLAIAKEFIPEADREAWARRRRRINERVTFLDYEIVEVRHAAMTAIEAEVLVSLTWTTKTSNVVETTRVVQEWKYIEDEKRWELAKQTEAQGDDAAEPIEDPSPF